VSDTECLHGFATADCATCGAGNRVGRASQADRVGHEKLLVFCPTITEDSLLHFNRQGDSYRLRAYVGELAGRPAWVQPDARTTPEFLRRYAPQFQVDVAPEQLSVDRADRWANIIATHNTRLGIGIQAAP
jgi:hypothetical protein